LPQINKTNVVCLFSSFCYKLLGCSPFNFMDENIEPFLGMLIILFCFFCCHLHYYSFSFLDEYVGTLLRMLIFSFVCFFFGSFKCLLQFLLDSHN
jgi:hypothetical protein